MDAAGPLGHNNCSKIDIRSLHSFYPLADVVVGSLSANGVGALAMAPVAPLPWQAKDVPCTSHPASPLWLNKMVHAENRTTIRADGVYRRQ